jgi:hypothetical protein
MWQERLRKRGGQSEPKLLATLEADATEAERLPAV